MKRRGIIGIIIGSLLLVIGIVLFILNNSIEGKYELIEIKGNDFSNKEINNKLELEVTKENMIISININGKTEKEIYTYDKEYLYDSTGKKINKYKINKKEIIITYINHSKDVDDNTYVFKKS